MKIDIGDGKRKGEYMAKPILLWILIQCVNVCLEDGITILIARVPFHKSIIHSNKTKG